MSYIIVSSLSLSCRIVCLRSRDGQAMPCSKGALPWATIPDKLWLGYTWNTGAERGKASFSRCRILCSVDSFQPG